TASGAERRRFQRFRFASVIRIQQGDGVRDCALIDVSFRGFLARCPAGWTPAPGERLRVEWHFAALIKLDLDAAVMHADRDPIGCTLQPRHAQACGPLEPLVEMTLAAPKLVTRELALLRSEPVRQFADAVH